ncbi:MAG: glycosyltransferase family 39 protein [Isosphaeraceae bacterium]
MLDLCLALFLAMVAAGVGRRLLLTFGRLPEHPADAMAMAVPLGLGALSLTCLMLGEIGCLNLTGLAVLLGVAAELGLPRGLGLTIALVRHGRSALRDPSVTRLDRVVGLFVAVTLAATGLSALAPVTDGDALCYHLQVPKVFLMRQAVGFEPDLHETVYPLVTEMLYAVALEFRGPVACRCIQWVLGLVFAAGVTALARPSLGRRAWWAGAVALLAPAISNGMTAPLNDVALAAFGTAAVLAWIRHMERPDACSAVLAGVYAGLAVGVKYPALVLVVLLASAMLVRPIFHGAWRSRSHGVHLLGLLAVFLAATAAVGGGWYVRSYVHTGNPVYPFFKGVFGSGLTEVLDPIKRPLSVDLWNLATSLVPLTLQPERFDSFAHQFGPAFLLFLPAVLLVGAPRRVLGLAGLGYVFVVLCLTQRQSMRFLLIAVGPMSVAVAYVAGRWLDRGTIPSRALVAVLLTVLGLEAGIAATRAARAAGVVLGRESFHDFLGRCEPTYRVGRWVGRNLPPAARLIGQDHRGFYIPRHYTMELAHRRRTGLGEHGESPQEIVETLRSEGYTHVMLCPPSGPVSVEFDATLGRLLAPWLSLHTPLYREGLHDRDGVTREYSIFSLADERLGAGGEGRSVTR